MKKTKQFRPTAFILNAKMKVSLMLLLMLMLVPQRMWAWGGSGTSSSPYTIANRADLHKFANIVNGVGGETKNASACAKLTDDITNLGTWTPIGNNGVYTGTFDGQGHTISGISISASFNNTGFFALIDGATIKNFTLAGTIESPNYSGIGSAVGRANGASKILDVQSSVNITVNGAHENIGGIVGWIESTTQVSGCTYTGTLDAGSSYKNIGGIVGYTPANAKNKITNCFFAGTIKTIATGSNNETAIGGILGYVNDETSGGTNFQGLSGCFHKGTLPNCTTKTNVAAIIGRPRGSSHLNVKNNSYLSGTAEYKLGNNFERDGKCDASNKAITISVTAGANGTVSQTYVNPTTSAATQLQVVATPNDHYYFKSWSDSKAQTHNVDLTADVSLTATFVHNPIITVETNNSDYGTVSGGGEYTYNSQQTIKATPKTGYKFVQWNDGNTSASRTITVTEDKTYTATFAPIPYTITVATNSSTMGTVSGGGTYDYGTQQTIKATPKEHYHFVEWNDGNTNASRTITVNGNATYTATFAPNQHTITLKTNDSNMGTVSGGDTYDYGTQQTISATPNTGYHFEQWNDGNTDASRTITVTENKTYTATFAPNQYTITVRADNGNYGTVIGGGTYDYGTQLTITATAKTGYHFEYWYGGNTDASRTITVTENKTYTAIFAPNQYNITVKANKYNYGTVTGGGTYNYQSIIQIRATPKEHYYFVEWNDGDRKIWRNITVTEDKTYTATFAPNQYTITVKTNNDNYGTVNGGGTFDYGSAETITATPKTGCHFVKWSDDNTNASRTITVNGHATYTAVFAKHTYGEWITDVEATCTTDGTKHRVCTHDGCNADDVVTIPAYHQWGDDHTCTVCGHAAEIAHTGTSGTCTWAIYEDGLMIVEPTEGETGTLEKWGDWVSAVPWNNYKDDIISVQFRGKVIAQRCEYMFYSCKNLRTIDFENFDTKNETSMYAMFSGCISLQSLDLSSFNTASVTDMSSMFNSCSSLQSLDLSSFNTASVTNMSSMFNFCPSLQSLDLSNFNTSSVTEMSSMFHSCEELAVLKLSNDFVIETECQTTYMFYDCGKSVMNGKIYYVLNGTTQNKIKSSNTACNYMDIVSSAIVKDGVPFKMSQSANVPGKDVVVTRQFAAQKPASVMLPFTVNDASQISGATFYEFKGVKYENGEWVATMQDVSTVAAYKPYVVIREGAGDITFGNGSQTVSFPVTPAASSMTTTDPETGWTFVALNETKTWEEGDPELDRAFLVTEESNTNADDNGSLNIELVKIEAGTTLKAGRCYFLMNEMPTIKGDVNNDGRVSIADLTLLIEILNGRAIDTTGNADVDGKNGVTTDDVEILRNIILSTQSSDAPDADGESSEQE